MGTVTRFEPPQTGIICPDFGIRFPPLYRVQGVYWQDGPSGPEPSGVPAPVQYALDAEDDCGVACVQRALLRRLDPSVDDGWVIIRHHWSEESMEGYVDAFMDLADGPRSNDMSFILDCGFFTVLHRRPRRRGPNHLIVYEACEPTRTGGRGCARWSRAITADGAAIEHDELDVLRRRHGDVGDDAAP